MILTENELFAPFVLLLAKIYFTDKVLLWVTQQLVTLDVSTVNFLPKERRRHGDIK